jgi:hypothetical protein
MTDEERKEIRRRARLAWNNWPDTEETRRKLDAHEARDSYSAAAWDRVVDAVLTFSPTTSVPNQNRRPNDRPYQESR